MLTKFHLIAAAVSANRATVVVDDLLTFEEDARKQRSLAMRVIREATASKGQVQNSTQVKEAKLTSTF
jgi:hypothetical protein